MCCIDQNATLVLKKFPNFLTAVYIKCCFTESIQHDLTVMFRSGSLSFTGPHLCRRICLCTLSFSKDTWIEPCAQTWSMPKMPWWSLGLPKSLFNQTCQRWSRRVCKKYVIKYDILLHYEQIIEILNLQLSSCSWSQSMPSCNDRTVSSWHLHMGAASSLLVSQWGQTASSKSKVMYTAWKGRTASTTWCLVLIYGIM